MTEDDARRDLLLLFGSDTLSEVLFRWRAERAAMLELHDVNTALKIVNRRLRIVVILAMKVFDLVEEHCALFIPPKAKDAINNARKQFREAENSMSSSRELVEINFTKRADA